MTLQHKNKGRKYKWKDWANYPKTENIGTKEKKRIELNIYQAHLIQFSKPSYKINIISILLFLFYRRANMFRKVK